MDRNWKKRWHEAGQNSSQIQTLTAVILISPASCFKAPWWAWPRVSRPSVSAFCLVLIGLLPTFRLALALKAIPVAAAAGLIGYFLPQVLGGGHALTEAVLSGQAGTELAWLSLLFAAKFALTMLSYGTGLPGGIFLPLLSLGALLGSLFGRLTQGLFPGIPHWVISFAVIGMAGYFVAIVRAPLTGIVLLTEMTGRYQHMLPLLLCCLAAYMTAEALGSLPIYESLLERLLAKGSQNREDHDQWGETILVEMAVEGGSPACNHQIRELRLPDRALLVSIKRGSREIIPRGHSNLLEGDVLRVMIPKHSSFGIRREIAGLLRYRP